jgi:periplasmic protein CpxP/Spy
MKHKLRHLTFAVSLVLAASCFASPPMEPPPPGGNPPPMADPRHEPVPPWLRGVTLTEEQHDNIFEIMHAQLPAFRAREKELQHAGDALMKLPLNAEFDDIKAKSLADAIARTTADIALSRTRNDAKIYRLLTPDQRKQVGNVPRPQERAGQAGEPCGETPRR